MREKKRTKNPTYLFHSINNLSHRVNQTEFQITVFHKKGTPHDIIFYLAVKQFS